ncbi:MAG: VWA domain-containing protein [Planctomycetia bacterium]|nr:VWA domain-containing protein [Planctomycetia bacterium]
MIAMLGMVAFSVDVGYIAKVNAELKRTCDAGALAGARSLVDGTGAAEQAVRDYVALNPVANHGVSSGDTIVECGSWDPNSRTFAVNSTTPSAVRVTLNNNAEPLFFARVLNTNSFNATAQSVAMHQPRDIMLVLDFSASMCYDSQFRQIPTLGRSLVESSLQQIYQDLSSPQYGTLTFTPQCATITGMSPTNSNMAQITTKFKNDDSAYVTSTKTINQVKLQFSNGATQTFSNPGGTTGTFKGTGSNSGRQIDAVYVKSGTNDNSGGSGEKFADDATTLKTLFGLANVAYPYAGDSWSNYISYVKSDTDVDNAGYRKMYGYMTWVNYLQAQRSAYSQTPDLWKTHEQPVTALKDSVTMFVNYISAGRNNDRLGLSIYTYSDQTAILESPLTANYLTLSTTTSQRQAGHYISGTNIYNGMRTARLELQNNGRVGAFRMMVLMTDGVANLPGSTTNAKNLVLQEAQAAATARIPIVTISMGALADTALMSQVASTSGGVYFNIPGGQTAAQYQEQLEAVWKQVADNKPLKLVE